MSESYTGEPVCLNEWDYSLLEPYYSSASAAVGFDGWVRTGAVDPMFGEWQIIVVGDDILAEHRKGREILAWYRGSWWHTRPLFYSGPPSKYLMIWNEKPGTDYGPYWRNLKGEGGWEM
jgi:hypothetical protein